MYVYVIEHKHKIIDKNMHETCGSFVHQYGFTTEPAAKRAIESRIEAEKEIYGLDPDTIRIYEENGQLVYHRTYKCGNDTEIVGSYIRKIEVKEE